MSNDEKLELASLQVKLDELYTFKAKGAFIRSRAKWLEEGEQNSSYFFNLEKHHFNNNDINRLNVNGIVTEDMKKISDFCFTFYTDLYRSRFSPSSSENFIKILTVNTLDKCDAELCDKLISLEEIKNATNNLKNNKSPGTDAYHQSFIKLLTMNLLPFC